VMRALRRVLPFI